MAEGLSKKAACATCEAIKAEYAEQDELEAENMVLAFDYDFNTEPEEKEVPAETESEFDIANEGYEFEEGDKGEGSVTITLDEEDAEALKNVLDEVEDQLESSLEEFHEDAEEELEDMKEEDAVEDMTEELADEDMVEEDEAMETLALKGGHLQKNADVVDSVEPKPVKSESPKNKQLKEPIAVEEVKDLGKTHDGKTMGKEEHVDKKGPDVPDKGGKATMGKEENFGVEKPEVPVKNQQLGNEELDGGDYDIKGTTLADSTQKAINEKFAQQELPKAEKIKESTPKEKKLDKVDHINESEVDVPSTGKTLGKEEPATKKAPEIPSKGDGARIGNETSVPKDGPNIPAGSGNLGNEELEGGDTRIKGTVLASCPQCGHDKVVASGNNAITCKSCKKRTVVKVSSSKDNKESDKVKSLSAKAAKAEKEVNETKVATARYKEACKTAASLLRDGLVEADEYETLVADLSEQAVPLIQKYEATVRKAASNRLTKTASKENPGLEIPLITRTASKESETEDLAQKLMNLMSLNKKNKMFESDEK